MNYYLTMYLHIVETIRLLEKIHQEKLGALVGAGLGYAAETAFASIIGAGGAATMASEKVVQRVSQGGQGAARNAANSVKLNAQLRYQEANSVFTKKGTLHPDVIKNSFELIKGSKLKNTRVIEALTSDGSSINSWAKMSTQTFKSPSGNFQVHFYQNLENGVISIFEMKAKINR